MPARAAYELAWRAQEAGRWMRTSGDGRRCPRSAEIDRTPCRSRPGRRANRVRLSYRRLAACWGPPTTPADTPAELGLWRIISSGKPVIAAVLRLT